MAKGSPDDSVSVKDKRDGFPIFIHSELDDYGLSNAEFRVYARLARRAGGQNGVAKESLPKMADAFMVSIQTVRRCLIVLRDSRLITERIRPGKATEYTLNPRSVWLDKKLLPTVRETAFGRTPDTTTPTRGDTPYMTDRGGVTPENGVPLTPQIHEGDPSEGTPKKGIPKDQQRGSRLPDDFSLNSDMREWAARNASHVNLETALDEFLDYWRGIPGQRGKKLDWPATWRNRMRELEARSMRNGKDNGTNKTRFESTPARNCRNLRENGEYIRELSRDGGAGDSEDPIGLLTSGI